MYGGTLLTITGQGFGTEAQIVEVMVGSHVCMVESVSDTKIQCRVEYTGAQVTVTNQGTRKGEFSLSVIAACTFMMPWSAYSDTKSPEVMVSVMYTFVS